MMQTNRIDRFLEWGMLLATAPFIVAAIRWTIDGFPGMTR